jgi:hypothetical protein
MLTVPGYREGMDSADQQVIACNYADPTKVASAGALAYVIPQFGGNLPERVRLLVRSRGGRWVEKWEAMWRLDNFRLKTLPPEHPRWGDERLWLHLNEASVSGEDVRWLTECKATIARERAST